MPDVLRNTIKEDRGSYFVEYRPADGASYLAMLYLVFPGATPDLAIVAGLMETELDHWLRRYAVPTMVWAWDGAENQIAVAEVTGDSLLVGFLDEGTDRVVKHWGVIPDSEMPTGQKGPDYQAHFYRDLPFRLRSDIRKAAIKKSRWTARSVKTAAFLIVAVPVGIELVSLGVDWIGHVLSAISIVSGALIVGRTMGWLKPSRRAAQKAEEENRMRHYFYHCERNPTGFARLKQENMELESAENIRTEAERLKGKSSAQ